MDITRKFIQMGRTRSLRYALRKGGKKYEHPDSAPETDDIKGKRKRSEDNDQDNEAESKEKGIGHEVSRGSGRKEIPRTGEVYDEEKLEGANIFEGYLDRCWADEVYSRAWQDWREEGKRKQSIKANGLRHDHDTMIEDE